MGGLSILFILGILMSMYLLLMIVLIIIIVYSLVNYIFESIFLYKVAKRRKYKYPVTAWIPFYNKCILGRIANNKKQGVSIFIIDLILIILILLSITENKFSSTVNTFIFILTVILIIVNFILNIIVSHNIMKKVLSKSADFLTLLNVFTIGFSRSIILFTLRDSNKILDN